MRINDRFKASFAFQLIGVFLLLIFLFYIIINLPIGNLKKVWSIDSFSYINAYQVSPSGKLVAIGQADGTLLLYNEEGSLLATHPFHDPVRKILFSPDENLVYVNTTNVSCYSIPEKKVLWQKFKKDFYVEDFWIFRNKQMGFFFSSKFNLNKLFTYADAKGITLQEFSFPQIFERFHIETSDNGAYVFITQSNGDVVAFQSNGLIQWTNHLDPPVLDNNLVYPILSDINNTGISIIAYPANDYGKTVYIAMIIDNKGDTIWKKKVDSPFQSIQFAQDSTKWLLAMDQTTQVLDLNGNVLFQRNQYGYEPVLASLGSTNVVIGYNAYKKTSEDSLKGTIIQVYALKKEYVIWQKKVIAEFGEYQVNRTGFVLLEIVKPNKANLYRLTDKNLLRKVFLWLF